MKRSAVIGIFFIILMLGSTVAYSVISAIRVSQPGEETSLPETNVIDYELSASQEKLLLQNGKVIAKFAYGVSCWECPQQKSYLESFARQYPNQIFLEEIAGNATVKNSILTFNSIRGYETLTNITQENILDVFCELMVQPPVDCALRNI